jgi:hypothetical protein
MCENRAGELDRTLACTHWLHWESMQSTAQQKTRQNPMDQDMTMSLFVISLV